MKSVVASAFAVIVLAGSALAAIPSTTDYMLATQPMISGKVVSVHDRAMVVATDQGAQVTLAMDSKTMVPTDLGPGMVARVEFKLMQDGRYYARRVIPIRDGMGMGRELAYARTHGGAAMAHAGSMSGHGHAMAHDASMSGGHMESLPQTASPQPLIALFGMLALGAAGALALLRRFRRA